METKWWKDRISFEAVKDQIFARGLLVAKPEAKPEGVSNLSVALQPSCFPEECFELGVKVQTPFNSLLDAISRDEDFMKKTFSSIAVIDSFISSLFKIYLEVLKQGNRQVTTFGIHRSDYLVEVKKSHLGETELGLKQVEINTISAGLVSYGCLVSLLHKYVLGRYSIKYGNQGRVLNNDCLRKVSDAMALAHKEYGKPNAQILFVPQSLEYGKFDQRHLEIDLWERHSVPVIRRTLSEIADGGKLTKERELLIDEIEISVVYYRSGYSPNDYPTDKEWEARKMMELSCASNCPSVAYQLIGCKKLQQILCERGILEKYCIDSEAVKLMRSTFAQQYSLEQGPKGDAVIEMVLKDPEPYVMKPQREGGGNNLYGQELLASLSAIKDSPQRKSYIIMEYINSPSLPNAVLKKGQDEPIQTNLVSEIGFYGVFIRRGDKVLVNDDAGYLLRSKPAGVKEGGLSVGVACADSPLLVSSDLYIQMI